MENREWREVSERMQDKQNEVQYWRSRSERLLEALLKVISECS